METAREAISAHERYEKQNFYVVHVIFFLHRCCEELVFATVQVGLLLFFTHADNPVGMTE